MHIWYTKSHHIDVVSAIIPSIWSKLFHNKFWDNWVLALNKGCLHLGRNSLWQLLWYSSPIRLVKYTDSRRNIKLWDCQKLVDFGGKIPISSMLLCIFKTRKTHYYILKPIATQCNTVPASNLKYLSIAPITKSIFSM